MFCCGRCLVLGWFVFFVVVVVVGDGWVYDLFEWMVYGEWWYFFVFC